VVSPPIPASPLLLTFISNLKSPPRRRRCCCCCRRWRSPRRRSWGRRVALHDSRRRRRVEHRRIGREGREGLHAVRGRGRWGRRHHCRRVIINCILRLLLHRLVLLIRHRHRCIRHPNGGRLGLLRIVDGINHDAPAEVRIRRFRHRIPVHRLILEVRSCCCRRDGTR